MAEFKQYRLDNYFIINRLTREPLISHSQCVGLKTQTPMQSKSIGCPKIVPPSAPVLYLSSHLTRISSLKAKNRRKTLIFTQLKMSRGKQRFSLFLDEFLYRELRPIDWSLTLELHWRTKCGVTNLSLALLGVEELSLWFITETVFWKRLVEITHHGAVFYSLCEFVQPLILLLFL